MSGAVCVGVSVVHIHRLHLSGNGSDQFQMLQIDQTYQQIFKNLKST